MVDRKIEAAFQVYLQPLERVVWTGRPPGGLRLALQDLWLIPLSIFFVALASQRSLSGPLDGRSAFSLTFAFVGFLAVFGRFAVDAWMRRETLYALTERRALVLQRAFQERLLSRRLGAQADVLRRADGSGSISFGAATPLVRSFADPRGTLGLWIPSLSSEVRFLGVPDILEVQRLAASGGAPAP